MHLKPHFSQMMLLVAVILLTVSCAQISNPKGGPKDTFPPVILKMVPPNETVNFDYSQITVQFDEYVQLNDIKNQLIISPALDTVPEITLKNKTLFIDFKSEFKKNTTYSLNFGEGIKDFNEGNVLRNFTIAFATGPVIDSLAISGDVFYAKDGEPAKNVKVLLYDQDVDSLPLSSKPTYVAQTNDQGKFQVKYLPEKEFKLFALEELNGDFIFNDSEENIGFLDNPVKSVVLGDSTVQDSVSISLFNEEQSFGYVDKVRTDSLNLFKVSFSKPQHDIKIKTVRDTAYADFVQRLSAAKDTLYLFAPLTNEVVLFRSDDRFNNTKIKRDTVLLKDEDLSASARANNNRIELSGFEQKGEEMYLQFSTYKPFDSIVGEINFMGKSDSMIYSSYSVSKTDNFNFLAKAQLPLDQTYEGLIKPKYLKHQVYTNQDTLKFSITTQLLNYYGELSMKIKLDLENPVFMIYSGNELYKAFSLEDKEVYLPQLLPGKYKVWLLEDANGDGAWTTGNYDLKLQPENIVKFPQEIEIRSNWSQEFIWE